MKHLRSIVWSSVLCVILSGTVQSQSWNTGSSSLYVNPTSTKVGIGLTTPICPIDVDAGTFSGSGGYKAGQFKLNSETNYFSGEMAAYLPYTSSWSSQSLGFGVYGTLKIRQSKAAVYVSKSGAGHFVTTFDNYTTDGSLTHYVYGTLGLIKGTISNPDNGIFASVIGIDDVDSANTWAGYFEGRGYFEGKVGIGTTDISDATLTVNGNIKADNFLKSDGTSLSVWNFNADGIDYSGGNVGIGTDSPVSPLHVEKALFGPNKPPEELAVIFGHNTNTETSFANPIGIYGKVNGMNGKAVFGENLNSLGYAGYFDGRGYFSGRVGIGTSGMVDAKLAVNGKIIATEVEVKVYPWSDYVFKEDYNLPSLSEVEKFISENNHLPEVPSEKEVHEKGVNLGEMDAILLKKIEELTLYMIEMEKQLVNKDKEIKELMEMIKSREK